LREEEFFGGEECFGEEFLFSSLILGRALTSSSTKFELAFSTKFLVELLKSVVLQSPKLIKDPILDPNVFVIPLSLVLLLFSNCFSFIVLLLKIPVAM